MGKNSSIVQNKEGNGEKCNFCEEKAVSFFSNLLGTVKQFDDGKYWNWSRLEPIRIFTCAHHTIKYVESTIDGVPIVTEYV